ncbi:MAG: hypothetical protein ACM359_02430 [Bacillota bacterium]
MTTTAPPTPTAAPADRRPREPWPLPAKFIAYAILSALAIASVWFINRRVDALAQDQPAKVVAE